MSKEWKQLREINDELFTALKALVEDAPHYCDAEECECDNFADDGTCCHVRAHKAIARAIAETT